MQSLSLFLIPAALAAAPAAAAEPTHGEVMLAAALKGRTAGEPVDCIKLDLIRAVQVIDGIGILFTTLDGTRYLNKPEHGAERLDSWDVVVADTHSPDLCKIDSVKLKDESSGHLNGVIGLGPFIPYRKADR